MAETTQKNWIELVWKSVDQTSDVLKGMGKGVSDFGKNLEFVTGPAASLTTGLLKIEAGALAIGVALGGFAVNEAGKFDASMRELSTLINGGEQGAQDFATAIAEMGQRSLVPLEDLTGAMYKAVSQTGSLDEAQKLVTVSEKLAVAGRADLTDTTLLLAGSLEAYGKNMDSAGKFSDTLFAIVQGGQTTLTELAAGLGGLAPTASNLGVSFDSLGAAVAVITKNSVPTSEALTGLKAIMSSILKPSKDASDLAAQLGINFTVSGLQAKGFAAFMVDVAAKTQGSAIKIGTLFGSMEAFNSVMALASEGGSKFNRMLKTIEESTGVTQKAYDLMAGAFGAGNQVILNNIKLLAIAFGTPLLDPVHHVQEALTNFFISIHESVMRGDFNEFFATARLGIENFAKSLETAITNLPEAFALLDFGPILDEISKLGDAFGAIGNNIDLTTVEGLAKALQLVIDGMTQFVALNRGMIEALPKVFTVLKDISGILLSLDPQWVALGGTILLTLTTLDKASGAWWALSAAFGGAGTALAAFTVLVEKAQIELALLAGQGVGGMAAAGIAATGLAAATGVAAYAFGSFVVNPFIDWLTKATTGSDTLGAAIYDWTHTKVPDAITATHSHAKATEEWSISQNKANDILTDSFAKWDAHSQQIERARDKTKELTGVNDEIAKNTAALTGAFERMGVSAADAAELALRGFTVVDKFMNTQEQGWHLVNDVFVQTGISAKEAAETIETALEKSFKATQAAKDKAEEFRLEWAKLESQNRNVVFEAVAKINVAQIEAQAAIAIAAFESIGESVKSTGDLIGKLSESFLGISSGKIFDKLLIESLLKEELQLRKDSFALQKRLVETQINYLNASTDKLKSGDALITIKGDGLAPELKMMMFKVLETIQIEASQNGQSFLLGLPQV